MGIKWDASYDVVVVGSGAGGLTAALTAQMKGLKALVIEKTEYYGGSSSLSGGAIWVPTNFHLDKARLGDTPEKAQAYLDATVGDRVSRKRKEAYVMRGAEMVKYLHEETKHVRFKYIPGYSDYYPERLGGYPQGRSIEPEIFNLKELGEERKLMRRANLPTYGMVMNAFEFHKLNMITRIWEGKKTSLKVGMRLMRTIFTGYRPSALGEALIGRLRKSLMDVNGDLWLSTAFQDYVVDNGRIVGIIAERGGKKVYIEAKKGVILASGGFSHNQKLREKYLPLPTKTEWTSASEGQTGDIIDASIRQGAAIDLMDRVWGAPSAVPPGEKPFFLVADRGIPNMMIVNSGGERYLNEAVPYHEFVDLMYENDKPEARTTPSYMIMDLTAKSRYIFLGLFPGQSFPKRWYENGFVKKAETAEELAKQIGVPVEKFVAQFEKFNQDARMGKDTQFGRGDSVYDRYYGDPTLPNPSISPMENVPFYAVPVVPGDIGTKGGLITDEYARVLREDGQIIDGLFAIGNCAAAVMGETYPGPGATLGPSMAFGYVAADYMANKK
ncbi:FAD-dependent oxidoreductase [Paenibacillus sp. N1-5-1-14]|uniref:FAD-dependent oxidoreductase n=1 Tax=Paenibacillus radicibacter TaxID=2972488 RepID=UPI002159AA1C|nr:FAD-dependent oxidoreductase [Paenibacillus radicibacter]MCR8644393.1 FAD-dependent oxidoreductase [Paenibacillus radicibacter]